MKKSIRMILSLVLVLVLGAALLVACNNKGGEEPETHTYSATWSNDASEHWHQCTQDGHTDVADKAAHTWNEGTITTDATFTRDGEKTYTCTVCQKTKTETVTMEYIDVNFAKSDA